MDCIQVSLLEDNPGERASYEKLLNGTPGFRCSHTYATAEEALAGIPTSPPDVLLADIRLAGEVRGIECVFELRQRLPTLPMLMLTAFEDADLLLRSLRAGAMGYLLKRDPPERLFQAIRDAARGEAALSSVMARKIAQFFRDQPEPTPVRSTAMQRLSQREHEILGLLAQGRRYKEITTQLGIQLSTLRTHIGRIYQKLHVRSRTEAAVLFSLAANGPGRIRGPRDSTG